MGLVGDLIYIVVIVAIFGFLMGVVWSYIPEKFRKKILRLFKNIYSTEEDKK